MHYYQFNIGDYRRDTAHLKPIEHYIYRSLIDWYYLDEKPIPKETQMVMRRLSIGSDLVNEVENVLQDFFVLSENGWVHGRIELDIREYHAKAEVNRLNGKLGGRPKKTQTVSSRLPNDNPSESESNPNQEPITNNHKPITNNKDKDKSFCAEPKGSTPKVIGKIIIELPLNVKGTFHQVMQSDVDEFTELYPAVDVIQEFRGMRGWCISNPTKLKTNTGIKKFINAWLSKAQNNPSRPKTNFNGANYGVKQVDGLKDAYMTFGLQEIQPQESLGYEIGR